MFGYYIEVSKSLTKDVPFHYVRKQTLANAERYITPELKELEERILSSNEKSVKLELELFAELIEKVKEKVTSLQQSARAIAAADVLGGFALLAVQQRYTKPKINPMGARTVIKAGRHPVVEAFSGDTFVSNDTFLDGEDQTLVITGPNMAGKSTYMRQVALITVMAHIGSFVPADSAEIALCDRIFTRIGASDNLLFDQSTFMVEMTEVAEILRNATANSLLILDEVGRGTGTFDGLSIAWATMEYIAREIGAKTLFATHYHELTELEGRLQGVKNYHVTVKETKEGILFLRKIVRGGTAKSFGIEVAALAGVPKEVTRRARDIMRQLEESDINNSNSRAAQLSMPLSEPALPAVTEGEQEVLESLRGLNPNALTPIDALTLLAELKAKLD